MLSPVAFPLERRGNSKTTTVPDESEMQLMDVVAKRVQPFVKLARFKWNLTGPWPLALWPFYWGAALAAENGALPDWKILTVLAMASQILCSAGCVVNDLWDKDFDEKVERSKLRPLVIGEVTSFQGWVFFGALNLFYVVVLSQLKTPVVLGVGINWSMFLGWSAVRGPMALGPPALPLALVYFAACCWTLVYETIYAHQDLKDDVDAGVKSMAILLGNDTKLWLSGFGMAFVASLGIAGHIIALGWPFYISVVATATHVGWQITTVDLKNPNDCFAKFLSNIWVGAFVFGGIVGAKLLT